MDNGNTEALKKVKEEFQKSKEKQTFAMELKNGDMIAVTKGPRVVLESPDSQTSLEVPEGVTSVVRYNIITDLKLLRKAVPHKECLVSPVVHFHITKVSSSEAKPQFKATIPHAASSDHLSSLKVRSGDIRRPKSMQEVRKERPDKDNEPYCEIRNDHSVVYSSDIRDMVCTSDEKICTSKILAIPVGMMETTENDATLKTFVKVKTLLCSHLYSYSSYAAKRKVCSVFLPHPEILFVIYVVVRRGFLYAKFYYPKIMLELLSFQSFIFDHRSLRQKWKRRN